MRGFLGHALGPLKFSGGQQSRQLQVAQSCAARRWHLREPANGATGDNLGSWTWMNMYSSKISPVSLAIPSCSISMTMGGRVNLNRSVSPRNLYVLSRRKDTFPSISVYQWTIKIQPRRKQMIQQIWKVYCIDIRLFDIPQSAWSYRNILNKASVTSNDIPERLKHYARNIPLTDISLARIPLQQLCTPKSGWNLKRLVLKLIITSS